MDRLKLVFTFVIMITIISSFLYWIGSNANEQKKARIEKVEEGFNYSKGIITDMHSHKGHSIDVSYNINGVDYKYSGGWDRNPRKLNSGDSISFKYSIAEPKVIITELEISY